MNKKPNIIFIITDQQRFDTIRELGATNYITPNIDKLVREGVSFNNCFIPAASCIPCRASLFSGYYPHNNKVWSNLDSWDKTWVSDLADNGYQCINIGKMHTQPFEATAGFHQRYITENKDRYLRSRYFFDDWDKSLAVRNLVKPQREIYRQREDYDSALGAFLWSIDEDMHPDIFVENRVHWWLSNSPKSEKPLFLQIGFPGPHPPYDPLPKYAELYKDVEFDLLEIEESDLENQPMPWKKLREHNYEIDHDSIKFYANPSMENRQRQRRYYAANVTMIDEAIGRIIKKLEETGYLENSIIIFTSDHGDALGDHGHSQKWTMYDSIMRVPCIVWSPNKFLPKKIEELCQLHDLGPTILELAGIKIEPNLDAISLLPALLDGKEFIGRDYVYAEEGASHVFDSSIAMLMIRDKRYKLIFFPDYDEGALFDLETDPNEICNLWNTEIEKRREMERKLLSWIVKSLYKSRNYNGIRSFEKKN
jgi:arylsulfatase